LIGPVCYCKRRYTDAFQLPPKIHHHSSSSSLTSTSSTLLTSTSKQQWRVLYPTTTDISILEPIGNGTFGGVYYAYDNKLNKPLIAKCARAVTDDTKAQEKADSYLEVEAYVNSKLCPNLSDDTDSTQLHCNQHVAPYLGQYVVNGTIHLLWEESGTYTLEDYIEMDNGWVQLAHDLDLISDTDEDDDKSSTTMSESEKKEQLHNKLAAEILRQILEGIAYCHSNGIVHRKVRVCVVLLCVMVCSI